MAASVHTPHYPATTMWNNMGDSPHTLPSTGSEYPTTMAYQYAPPTAGLDPSSAMLHHHNIQDGLSNYAQGYSPSGPPPSPTSAKHRTHSVASTTKSSKMKRSMSSPNVRGQATADAAALALSAEKRRNKLGYHRTSVACGHCRRRKIRCIPSPADTQNRCINCIRLKKDCNFFPVDQQPPDTSASRRGSKAQSGTGQVSETSSPASVHLPELQNNVPYTHLTMPAIQDLGGAQTKTEEGSNSSSPETKVLSHSRTFDYPQTSSNWMGQESSSATRAPVSDMNTGYWRPPQEPPASPTFSSYASNTVPQPAPQHWNGQPPEQSPREDPWSTPQRSISYGNLEGLHNQPQQFAPYPPPPNHIPENYTIKPRMMQPGMYPPISAAASTMPTSSQQSVGPPHQSSYQPQWQQPLQYDYQHGGQQHFPENSQGHNIYGYGLPAPGPYHHGPPHPHQGR